MEDHDMSAVALALINAVTAAGGAIALDGQDLQLEAQEPLSPFLLASLRQHKPLLLAYLAEQAANSNQPTDTPCGDTAKGVAIADTLGGSPAQGVTRLVSASAPTKPTPSTTQPPKPPVLPAPMPPVVEPGPWSAGIPDEIARGLGALFVAPSARGILDHHWRTVVNDTLALVDSGQAAQAFALGWSAADLFGCDAVAPWHRLDRAGLMLLLQGREIAQWTASDAALRHRDGNVLRFRRVLVPPSPPVAMLWHLLPKRLRPAVGPAP